MACDDPVNGQEQQQEPQQSTEVTVLQERIRHEWHEERWFFSIIDVIGVLTGSEMPRRYWTDMKRRIKDEGFVEVYAKCVQLKMRAPDGKMRETDAADMETLLRIIQSIPSPRAEPLKQWLAQVGTERLAEIEDPSLAVERARRTYSQQGYSTDWIEKRLQGIVIRQELTQEWSGRGAKEGKEFALLTDTLHRGTFEIDTDDHKAIKRLKPRQNLRDSMTTLELLLTSITEETSRTLHVTRDSQGFDELHRDAHEAGEVGGATRRDIEQRSGQPVVSAENYKALRTGQQRELQPPLLDAREEGSESEP